MPKSRTRKNRKRYRPQQAAPSFAAAGQHAAQNGSAAHGDVPAGETPSTVRGLLTAHHSELLAQIVSYLPLPFGCWIAGGLRLPDAVGFGALLAIVVAHHYFEILHRGRYPLPVKKSWCLAVAAAATGVFAWWSADLLASALAALYVILAFGGAVLPVTTPRAICLAIAAVVGRCSVLAMLAVYSQIHRLIGLTAIFGYVPAMHLGAAMIALHSAVLLQSGWIRSYAAKDRKGNDVVRPGRLAQAFAFLLIFGPAVSIGLGVLGVIPSVFILTGIPAYFMPKLATAFLEELAPDTVLGERCIRVAAIAALTVLAAGLLGG